MKNKIYTLSIIIFSVICGIISSLSVIDSLFAIYLGIRRSKYSFYFYVVNDLILIALWGIPVISGSLILLPMVFNPIINLINDMYGIHNWKKLEKIQGGQ
jgi:hypothetical protein